MKSLLVVPAVLWGFFFFCVVVVVVVVDGLDVEYVEYECDSSLYVTADFSQIACSGEQRSNRHRNDSSRCTFGESKASVVGFRKYSVCACVQEPFGTVWMPEQACPTCMSPS